MSLHFPYQGTIKKEVIHHEFNHPSLWVGCPRNNQFFFSVRTETNQNSVSVVFRFVSRNQKTFFLVCFGVLDRYWNNRNKQNLIETNRKNLRKTFSSRGSSKPLIFFLGLNRNKPKLNLFRLFFSLLFRKTQKFFLRFVSVCFDVSDRYRNNWNKQNSWLGN
jgi:hypothetical protein